jgi:hypothetical protein
MSLRNSLSPGKSLFFLVSRYPPLGSSASPLGSCRHHGIPYLKPGLGHDAFMCFGHSAGQSSLRLFITAACKVVVGPQPYVFGGLSPHNRHIRRSMWASTQPIHWRHLFGLPATTGASRLLSSSYRSLSNHNSCSPGSPELLTHLEDRISSALRSFLFDSVERCGKSRVLHIWRSSLVDEPGWQLDPAHWTTLGCSSGQSMLGLGH